MSLVATRFFFVFAHQWECVKSRDDWNTRRKQGQTLIFLAFKKSAWVRKISEIIKKWMIFPVPGVPRWSDSSDFASKEILGKNTKLQNPLSLDEGLSAQMFRNISSHPIQHSVGWCIFRKPVSPPSLSLPSFLCISNVAKCCTKMAVVFRLLPFSR